MKIYIMTFILLAMGIKSFGADTDQDYQSQRLFDSANIAVEKSQEDRETFKKDDNYREIAKEKDDPWFKKMESIIKDK